MFSARFDEQDENDQILDETELSKSLYIIQKLTQSDIDIIGLRSQLERQIQNQELKDIDWRFDKIILVTKYFYETSELKGLSYIRKSEYLVQLFKILETMKKIDYFDQS